MKNYACCAIAAETTSPRVLKIVCYRRTNESTKSHRHDKAVSPAFNRIIVKAGVPDKRGRLERLPVLLFSQPITVTSFFFSSPCPPSRRHHSFRHERPSGHPLHPSFLRCISLFLTLPLTPDLTRPLFRREFPRPPTSFAASQKRRERTYTSDRSSISNGRRFCGGVCTRSYTFVN